MRESSDLVHAERRTRTLDTMCGTKNCVQHFTIAAGSFQSEKPGFHALKMLTGLFKECASESAQINFHNNNSEPLSRY